jgi:hypothetical protein
MAASGVIDALFGDGLKNVLGQTALPAFPRKEYKIRRVIGGSQSTVKATTVTRNPYRKSYGGSARGGEPVEVQIGLDWFTVDIGMSHRNFCSLLIEAAKSGTQTYWRSQKGSQYGPLVVAGTLTTGNAPPVLFEDEA